MSKPLPPRRKTSSREAYWREMFNDFSALESDHAISGWSPQGLSLRMKSYVQALPSLNLKPGALVLDLGCGAGAYSRVLGEAGFRVTGVDYAWLVAGQARRRTTLKNVDFLSGDATCLPFADNLFDHVVCIGLFQSLHKHREAMAEIHRVLKPGGVLCLITLNRRNLKAVLDRKLGREEIIVVEGQSQARLNTYDPKVFQDELAEVGFIDLNRRPVQIYPEWLNPVSTVIDLWSRVPALGDLTARSFMITGTKPP
ncbi:Methyltransferase domain-containing protein [Geoalkalibacter ferrihydriticus]|uniref:Methyltransferase domain-containing protein n=1 Tax=Geoalkalibacter ferrihydriticus TaxID=392333 RepID=A0A1G9WHW2_9BACT|nr:class I SAM-dependent methyltransferase [Geoalkalibacter ferrihydriticus]SDM83655.1 Methyltransferase domain-containing protein [Geoalkalibacter ferrihydriticus]